MSTDTRVGGSRETTSETLHKCSGMQIFLIDEGSSLAEQRSHTADLIREAADSGARQIVLDVYYGAETASDTKMREAIAYARERGIPIFSCSHAGYSSSPNRFSGDGIETGHCRVKGHMQGIIRRELNATHLETVRQTDGDEPHISLPVLAAMSCVDYSESDIRQFLEDNRLIGWFDLITEDTHPPRSYTDCRGNISEGSIVFLGGSADADPKKTDHGYVTPGVYDIASAYFSTLLNIVWGSSEEK